MAYGINWDLLRPNTDYGAQAMAGFERGRAMAARTHEDRAMSEFATDPNNPDKQAALLRYAPEKGAALLRLQRERQSWKREDEFRSALGDYVSSNSGALGGGVMSGLPRRPQGVLAGALGGGGLGQQTDALSGQRPALQPNALTGLVPQPGAAAPNALGASSSAPLLGGAPAASVLGGALDRSPAAPGGAPAADPTQVDPDDYRGAVDQQSAAFARMAKADPVKAMAAVQEHYKAAKSRLDLMSAVYDEAYEELASVSDDESYQRTLDWVQKEFQPYGIDIRTIVPPTFPGTKGVRELRYRALDAKDQLVAADRYMRLQWDIEDDIADNERADRNTASLIEHRDDQEGIAIRGQNIRSGDTRRGQDLADARGRHGIEVASEDRRRGQDLASSDRRRGQDQRGARGGGQNIPTVKTPEEARALPKGTVFRTPDGRVKVR